MRVETEDGIPAFTKIGDQLVLTVDTDAAGEVIVVLDAVTGREQTRITVPEVVGSPVAIGGRWWYEASGDGLVVVDPATGQVDASLDFERAGRPAETADGLVVVVHRNAEGDSLAEPGPAGHTPGG